MLKNELKRHEDIIKAKDDEIKEFKTLLEKQREERKRRSSNLGSSRSLTSSLKESGMI